MISTHVCSIYLLVPGGSQTSSSKTFHILEQAGLLETSTLWFSPNAKFVPLNLTQNNTKLT